MVPLTKDSKVRRAHRRRENAPATCIYVVKSTRPTTEDQTGQAQTGKETSGLPTSARETELDAPKYLRNKMTWVKKPAQINRRNFHPCRTLEVSITGV